MTKTQNAAAGVNTSAAPTQVDRQLTSRIATIGLAAALHERTAGHRARLIAHLADPMATDSRTCYATWLRRQTTAWSQLNLPAVPVASLEWPLASVRPQCLDVVGLLIADLRDLDPGRRRVPLPGTAAAQSDSSPAVCVAAAHVCVAVAELSAGLLASATALTADSTATGRATRYLQRCVQLSDRGAGLDRELDGWGAAADPVALQQAVLSAELFSVRLADAFDAGTHTGW